MTERPGLSIVERALSVVWILLVLGSLAALSEAPASRQVVDHGPLEERFGYSPNQVPPGWGGQLCDPETLSELDGVVQARTWRS